MGRTFVIGDIHGGHRALTQCLQKASFDYSSDYLISLGDVCDGWPDTKACVDELMTIKNLTYILGNHDLWTLEWMTTGIRETLWAVQGGDATIQSYRDGVPPGHVKFFQDALPYYILENKMFVHAGFDPSRNLNQQGLDLFLWDRTLARTALDSYMKNDVVRFTNFDEVYLGHTPIPFQHPIKAGDVWLMDTGAGWSGVLSMMDVESKEVFSSDSLPLLYPGVKGRSKR